jgi:hypothetical protein
MFINVCTWFYLRTYGNVQCSHSAVKEKVCTA